MSNFGSIWSHLGGADGHVAEPPFRRLAKKLRNRDLRGSVSSSCIASHWPGCMSLSLPSLHMVAAALTLCSSIASAGGVSIGIHQVPWQHLRHEVQGIATRARLKQVIESRSFLNLGVPRPPLCAEHECRAVTMPKNDAECRMIYAECRAMTCDRCRCRADDHGTGKNH